MNKDLKQYQAAVQEPGVSGFEVLDMLMVRDKLLLQDASLSSGERVQLAAADQQLATNAVEFYTELKQITDLEFERQRRKPTSAQWWWYLDVLLQTPLRLNNLPETAFVLA